MLQYRLKRFARETWRVINEIISNRDNVLHSIIVKFTALEFVNAESCLRNIPQLLFCVKVMLYTNETRILRHVITARFCAMNCSRKCNKVLSELHLDYFYRGTTWIPSHQKSIEKNDVTTSLGFVRSVYKLNTNKTQQDNSFHFHIPIISDCQHRVT
jgi:hypothetical protein